MRHMILQCIITKDIKRKLKSKFRKKNTCSIDATFDLVNENITNKFINTFSEHLFTKFVYSIDQVSYKYNTFLPDVLKR